jgi:hypothetical protein
MSVLEAIPFRIWYLGQIMTSDSQKVHLSVIKKLAELL